MIKVCEPLISVTPSKNYFASVPLLTTLSPWHWSYLMLCVWRFWHCEFSLLVVINLGVLHDSSGLVCIASTEMNFLCLVCHPVQTGEQLQLSTHKLQFKNDLHVIFSPECSEWGEDTDWTISWAAWNQHGSLSYPISSWVGYHNYWVGYLRPLGHGIGKSHQCNSEAKV